MNFTNLIDWMKKNNFIEGKSGFLHKKGMDEESTICAFKVLEKYGFINDVSDIVFAYSGLLRGRNTYYNALMVITKYQFIFVNYDNPKDVLVGIYNKDNIKCVDGIESKENTFIKDLAVITSTLDDPDHIYALHIGKRLNEIGDFVIKCINEMEESTSKYGLFRLNG